ncbi:SBBP repeat-containing protein [Pleurocapsales cyanobacterium LEGE 06147]|nr:SBBP repeat-containing protein [Pleurocapsales cyanobacterium LEGE 06147]
MSSLPANLFKLAQSFVVLELFGLVLGTPGSDAFVVGFPDKNDLLLGRQGSDVLLAVDPGSDNPGQGEIDTLVGDLDLFDVFPLPGIGPQEQTPRSWQDRFILGDWQQPYYVGSGSDDYALILDFEPDLDIIQLHGTPQDYELVETLNRTELFWQQENAEPDLIASLPGVSGLSLNDQSFRFENTPPSGPVLEEIEQLGTAGVDFSVGIDTNNSGEVYLTGTSADSFWVAKYDSNGNQQWLKQAPSTGNLATDNLGNIYLGGGLGDATVAKYDSDGNQLWEQQFGTFTLDNSFNLDVDDSGNVYLTGYTLGDLGGMNAGELAVGPFPLFSTDPWIVKYDSDGNQQWLTQFGSADFDEAFAITTDSNSNVYTSGWTFGDLGGTNAGLYDVWVAKHDTDGNQQWRTQFGSADYDWAWDAATDNQDNVYITGWTLGDLGGASAGSYDGWVAKYDSDGNQQWIEQFGTAGDDIARTIDVDDLGNFYLTGYTDSDFGGTNTGSYDTWVAKYDSDGNQQWRTQFGTSEIDNPFDLSVNNADEVFVTGFTEGSLGGTNAGSYDAWLAKLSSVDGSLLNFSQSSETESLLPDTGLPSAMLS